MSLNTPKFKRLSFRSLLFHTGFWALSFFILLRIFTREYDNGTVDIIYTFLFQIPLFVIVLINYKLIQAFVNKKKYIHYLGFVVLLIVLGLFLHHLVFDFLGNFFFSGYYFISIISDWDLIQYFLVYLSVSFMLFLSKNWFELREKQALLEKENKEVQLRSLKAQLNPHFLFNSLNNIYSLSNLSENRGKDYLLKLSDALRYMLYKSDEKMVALDEELDYIVNYIELEKLRLENDAQVNYTIDVKETKLKIAPLILLPIIENTFKHADKERLWIEFQITLSNGILKLHSKNNISDSDHPNESGGIGLVNLQKRLDLIYLNRHNWEVSKDSGFYESELKIKL